MRQLFSFFVLGLVLGLSPAVYADDSGTVAPKQAVGDWWALKDPNTGTIETIVVQEVAPNGDFTVVDDKTGNRVSIYTAELNKKELGDLHLGPHNWNYSFPLTQGKKWDEAVSISSYRGAMSYRIRGEVAGPEEIVLNFLNGTKKTLTAIRVETVATIKGWPSKTTCWYADELRFPARCISSDKSFWSREVVALGHAADPKPQY